MALKLPQVKILPNNFTVMVKEKGKRKKILIKNRVL